MTINISLLYLINRHFCFDLIFAYITAPRLMNYRCDVVAAKSRHTTALFNLFFLKQYLSHYATMWGLVVISYAYLTVGRHVPCARQTGRQSFHSRNRKVTLFQSTHLSDHRLLLLSNNNSPLFLSTNLPLSSCIFLVFIRRKRVCSPFVAIRASGHLLLSPSIETA